MNFMIWSVGGFILGFLTPVIVVSLAFELLPSDELREEAE